MEVGRNREGCEPDCVSKRVRTRPSGVCPRDDYNCESKNKAKNPFSKTDRRTYEKKGCARRVRRRDTLKEEDLGEKPRGVRVRLRKQACPHETEWCLSKKNEESFMKLILLGAQGSGKGTLAKKISKEFGIPQISTGDLFRESIAKKEKLGLEAQSYMQKGVLVPLNLTLQILKARIEKPDCQKGFILDGFPRSIEQANALKKITDIDVVINVELPLDECVRRLESRRTCPKCGDIDNTNYEGFTQVRCKTLPA